MLLRNFLVIFSVYLLVYVQTNTFFSSKTAACITTDIVKLYHIHYIYLLHSSNGEGKFLHIFFHVEKDFQTYSIPFAMLGMRYYLRLLLESSYKCNFIVSYNVYNENKFIRNLKASTEKVNCIFSMCKI